MNPKEFFSFKGRMRRKHYLAVYFAALALMIIIGLLQRATGSSLSILTFTVVAALVPPSVRRLHDIGYSGWLVIGVIAIPIASLLLLLAPSEPTSNAYGHNPTTQMG
jgi:uncharacterized membrane protein YhaH (DUF805 family)